MNEQEQLISGDQLGFGTEPEPDGVSGAFEATGEGADDGKLARAEPAPAGSTSARISVRELTAGKIASIFRIDQVSEHKTKAGKPYMRLTFGDASGTIAAVCWDGVNEIIEFCKSGAIVAVQGEYEINERYGPQLTVRSVSAANEGDYDLVDLQDVPLFPYDKLEREFNELVGSVRDPHLTQVLARLLGPDTETGAAFMEMPAAKKNHQAYKHGLLEHTLTVAQGVAAAAEVFPGINRDLAVAGALLHDIGKLDAYAQNDGGIDLTDDGKLQCEIPLGYYRIKRTIEDIEGFPPKLAQALLHIQLSHHGKLEHGSPVTPAIREAVLVSQMDNLGGTLGTYDRLEKGLAGDGEWSQYDRAVGDNGGSAYFGHSEGISGRE